MVFPDRLATKRSRQWSGTLAYRCALLCCITSVFSAPFSSSAGRSFGPWPTGHLIRSAKLIQDDVDAEEEAEEHMEEVPRLNWPRGAYSW